MPRHLISKVSVNNIRIMLTLVGCSAIMKYHSLKMEEVNDTMRHLWNRTYQGTGKLNTKVELECCLHVSLDIDGIKIVSDGESGGTKRTYNYRVSALLSVYTSFLIFHRL